MIDTTDIIRTHVQAVTAMLLGGSKMEDGIAIVGGAPLDVEGRIGVGKMAKEAGTDIVHLEFDRAEHSDFGLRGINLFAVRDEMCFIQTRCQLWLPRTGKRAVILPQAHVRGQFRLNPRELIHIAGKPTDTEQGIERAQVRLNRLVERDVFDGTQTTMTVLPKAA
ncbi:hypothetical protein [Hephaestia caeni]|nr:hypothetical protein [Hephaestia caeni]